MSSYNGATFQCLIGDSSGFRPDWERELALTITHIPGSDGDDVQSGGLMNARITIPARIDSDAHYALLVAAIGITKRTLGSFYASNYTNVMLVAIRNPRRLANAATWFCDLEFMRSST